MRNWFKKNWGLIGCFVTLLFVLAFCIPRPAEAQSRGYEFQLNGRTIATNPNTMSGPSGCRSDLYHLPTQRLVCPGDDVATPDSIWRLYIARECGMTRVNESYGTSPSSCIGGFVAVGNDCPRLPQNCRYYRIIDSYAQQEQWTVSVTRIHELGREMWIARPAGTHWSMFSRCHAGQYAQYPNRRYTC